MNNGEFRPGELANYHDAGSPPVAGLNADVQLAIAWVCLARERGFATPARRVTVLKPIVC